MSSLRISVSPRFTKENYAGEVPVYLRLTLDGQRTEISLKTWILKKDWSSRYKCVTGAKAKRINELIDEEISYIKGIKRHFDLSEMPYGIEDIRNKYIGVSNLNNAFILDRFQQHIDYMISLEGKSFTNRTIQGYRVSYRHLKTFILVKYKSSELNLSRVNYQFVKDYDVFLRTSLELNHNSTTRHLKVLKKIINECLGEGLITIDPFHRFKLGYRPADREALSEKDLEKLIEKKFRLEKLNRVKDCFVFLCLTALSYVDAKKLTPANLYKTSEGDFILKGNRQKSKEPFIIPLLPEAHRILRKYKDYPLCVQKGVLLPMLSNQKMNDYLKEIADILDIDTNISCHIARYTFITTVAVANEIPVSIAGAIAGQASHRMTDAYTKLKEMQVVKQMKRLECIY